MTKAEALEAARGLQAAIKAADDVGLFDVLPDYCTSERPGAGVPPDVINEFIEAVDRLEEDYSHAPD